GVDVLNAPEALIGCSAVDDLTKSGVRIRLSGAVRQEYVSCPCAQGGVGQAPEGEPAADDQQPRPAVVLEGAFGGRAMVGDVGDHVAISAHFGRGEVVRAVAR